MNDKFKIILNGLFKENPIFVLLLGMCPTLGTTTSSLNGMSMGLATTFVLIGSNIVISLLKDLIPDKVHIPAYIIVIAAFVTVLQMCMEAYTPELYSSLGLFIPLIVVNCIVLGRAEAYAAKHSVFDSSLDGLGMGFGFTFALGLLGFVRELLGSGSILSMPIINEQYNMLLFVLAPGGFIVLGLLIALSNHIKNNTRKNALKA